MTATVTARCLGDFSLTINGTVVDRWRAGRARSLFQYLLVHRGRLIQRDRLYEVLWPATERSSGSSSLKVAVHALRGILATATAGQPAVEIASHGSGYVLRADDVWVDFEQFEQAAAAGDEAESRGDIATMLAQHRIAADLYRDDFLVGEEADWAVEQREWLRGRALRTFAVLRAEAEDRTDPVGVAQWSRRILRIDPYHEQTYRALMIMHGERGEVGQVRRWHELCVQRLRRDLAVDPTPETDQVYAYLVRAHRTTHRRTPALSVHSV